MQISPVSPIQALGATERHADPTQVRGQVRTAGEQRNAAEPVAPKPFTPAPPLRPNVQDYVDINRTLIALRRM